MANQYFYLDSSSLATATKLYADMRGSTLGPSGYYSNSTIWRYWTGTQFSNQGNCNTATNAPTPPPTSPPTNPPTPSPITPPPTPAPTAPTPPPVTSPPTNPPTPAPITNPPTNPPTPSPATPPPTPAPVSAQSYIFYGCDGGGGLLDYDGNLGVGVVVKVSGFGCATIYSTSTSSPSYYGYSEYDSCSDCTDTPAPTDAPTPAPVTPSPTPAPTSVTCYRYQVNKSIYASYVVYAYTCCDGTYMNSQVSYVSTTYVCVRNNTISVYTGGSASNMYIPCSGC